jgi:hypothetical protein
VHGRQRWFEKEKIKRPPRRHEGHEGKATKKSRFGSVTDAGRDDVHAAKHGSDNQVLLPKMLFFVALPFVIFVSSWWSFDLVF